VHGRLSLPARITTVTNSLVLRPLLGTLQNSLFPGAKDWNRNVFSWQQKVVVDRSSFSCVGSVFHARGAATQKALSLICRHFRSMTRSPAVAVPGRQDRQVVASH